MIGAPLLLALSAIALFQTPVTAQSGLTLTVACGTTPGEVVLTILNRSDAATAVLLGYALANGRLYLPRELIVEIKRHPDSDFEELRYGGPAGIVGRVDHWVVTLPVRDGFTLSLRAIDFFSAAVGFRPLTGPPDALRVRLTGRPITSDLSLDMTGMKLWRLWTGTAVSNNLPVATQCKP